MVASSPHSITLHADQEHDGLRSIVVFQLFIIIPLSYWLIYTILNNIPNSNIADYAISLSCFGGLVLGLGISWVIEQLLKRFWHSGQALEITDNHVQVFQHNEAAFTMTPAAGVNQLAWYFLMNTAQKTGRERRLPKKWLCLAYQLLQEENRLVVYAYMSKKEARRWLDDGATAVPFHELDMEELLDADSQGRFRLSKTIEFPAGLLTGKNGRYWVAERHRGRTGMELTRQDFATFVSQMKPYHSQPIE